MDVTTSPDTTEQLLTTWVDECYTLCRLLFKTYKLPPPNLEFFNRGMTAGTAHLGSNTIRLNVAMAHCNLETYRTEIIPHEFGHLIADARGSRGHDKIWKRVMAKIGAPANSHHTMIVDGIRQQQDYHRVSWTSSVTGDVVVFDTRKELIAALISAASAQNQPHTWVIEQATLAGVKTNTTRAYLRSHTLVETKH